MINLMQRLFKRNGSKYDKCEDEFDHQLEGIGYTREEIDVARESEAQIKRYIPICGYIYAATAMGREVSLSSENPNMSDLDKMVLIRIKAAQLAYGHSHFVHCDQNCPGYTPIPVEEFSIGSDRVICKRLIPEPMVPNDTVEEWERLRQKAQNFNKNESSQNIKKYWTGDDLSYRDRYRRAEFITGLAAVCLIVGVGSSIVLYGLREKERENKQFIQEIKRQGLETRMSTIEGTLDGNFVTLTTGVNYLISEFYPPIDTTEAYQLRHLYDADGLTGRIVCIRKK